MSSIHEVDERPWISWPIIFALLAFALGLASPDVFGDPDSMWHVKAGQWMLEQGRIHTSDSFSHSMPGAPWTAHEWGSELVMAVAYDTWGWAGVHLVTAFAFSLAIAVVARHVVRHLLPVHAVTLLAMSMALTNSHFLARPHVLAWPFLAIWLASLARSVESGKRPSWWLIPLLVCWLNFHGSFMLGLVYSALFALEALFEAADRAVRLKRFKSWALFGAAAALATLLNPSGIGLATHTVEVMGKSVALALISEWQSTDFHEFHLFTLWLAFIAALALTGRLRLSVPRLLMLFVVTYLALKHVRYHSLVGLIAPFVLAPSLARGLLTAPDHAVQALRVDRAFERLMRPAKTSAMMAIYAVVALSSIVGVEHWRSAPLPAAAPQKAVDAALTSGATGPVLNDYGFGGYLIFRDIPVFIDGRSDMYGDPFLTTMTDATRLRKSGALEALMRQYNIGWTMFQPEQAVVQYLDRLEDWQRVYSDSIAVIHVRRSPVNVETPVIDREDRPQ